MRRMLFFSSLQCSISTLDLPKAWKVFRFKELEGRTMGARSTMQYYGFSVVAPRVGLEPTTIRLTAERSAN
jgi:hypothetical protein